MADKLVIRREKVVKMLAPLLPYTYQYANLVGDINGGGRGFSWDGDPAHLIKWIGINSGDDEPMNLQHLDCTIDQQWEMKETSAQITQYRKYRDILDRVYETEADVMADNVLADYLQNKRPVNMAKYVSAKLYESAVASGHTELVIETDEVTKDNIVGYFDQLNIAQDENIPGANDKTFYISYSGYAALKASDLNKRIVMNGDTAIGRDIESIDGVKIKRVSQNTLKTLVNATGRGYVTPEDAKNIFGIMVVDSAIAHPYGIDDIRVDAPSALSDNKQVFGNWYSFDVFQHPGYNGWGVGVIVEPAAASTDVNP